MSRLRSRYMGIMTRKQIRKPRILITPDDELNALIREVAELRRVSGAAVVLELLQPYRTELRDTVERLRVFKKKRRRRAY